MYSLEGKVVVVTGSGRKNGIGEALLHRFSEEGCRIVLSDIGYSNDQHFPETGIGLTKEMDEITRELQQKNTEVLCVPCDVRYEEQVENLIFKTINTFGTIDVFINNAGVGYILQLLTDMSIDEWNAVIDVNLKGYFLGIKHAAKQMMKQFEKSGTSGRIINIGAQASKSGFPYAGAYSASKHGIIGLTRSAALELAKYSITVNAICPNHITTDLGAWQNEFFSEKQGISYNQYLEDIKQKIPLGRTGLTTDIAKAAAFLASDEASYITGEALNVSGGEEMH